MRATPPSVKARPNIVYFKSKYKMALFEAIKKAELDSEYTTMANLISCSNNAVSQKLT